MVRINNNIMTNYFDNLPSVLKICIYEYDITYHIIYKTVLTQLKNNFYPSPPRLIRQLTIY